MWPASRKEKLVSLSVKSTSCWMKSGSTVWLLWVRVFVSGCLVPRVQVVFYWTANSFHEQNIQVSRMSCWADDQLCFLRCRGSQSCHLSFHINALLQICSQISLFQTYLNFSHGHFHPIPRALELCFDTFRGALPWQKPCPGLKTISATNNVKNWSKSAFLRFFSVL